MSDSATTEAEPATRPHLYGHLGMQMTVVTEMASSALVPAGPDIKTPGGIRTALLALLMEAGFGGNFLQYGLFPVLDNMTVHVRDGGADVELLKSEGELVRKGAQRGMARAR